MTSDTERLLRAMLDAKRAYDAASDAQSRAWKAYLDAQTAFTGKFSGGDYPLGPFVVGTTLIEYENYTATWPPKDRVFSYTEVVRCPTSD